MMLPKLRRFESLLDRATFLIATSNSARDPGLAVCVMPGTELALAGEVACLPTGLLGWRTQNQPPDGYLSTGQQGQVGRASRCTRISTRADRVADAAVRGCQAKGAAAACAANDRG